MELTAVPWNKYGNSRTYLNSPEGACVAWIDNRTGSVTYKNEQLRPAVEQWLADNQPRPKPALEPAADPPVPEASPPTADVDLAANRPGQGVRARAEEELSTMRSTSRFGTFLLKAFDVNTEERQWRVGANGEESVGDRLEKLKKAGWEVLHSVPIGSNGSDIDHLLVGPGGVWTINTKNHPGKKVWVAGRNVRVDGFPQPYIRNSEFEADRVRKILRQRLGWEPFVRSALVLLTGTIIPQVTIKSHPDNVTILDRMDVPGVFKRSDERLTAAQIAEIFEIARWQSTWVPGCR